MEKLWTSIKTEWKTYTIYMDGIDTMLLLENKLLPWEIEKKLYAIELCFSFFHLIIRVFVCVYFSEW